uniref:(northern house mosquito) hypothetical protein n=1 Tax=Culex pipiens TaxID=7175 RepID=A0A8D7ZXS7_CULPI
MPPDVPKVGIFLFVRFPTLGAVVQAVFVTMHRNRRESSMVATRGLFHGPRNGLRLLRVRNFDLNLKRIDTADCIALVLIGGLVVVKFLQQVLVVVQFQIVVNNELLLDYGVAV